MAKKRKGTGKVVKMLSPENYVRTKARTLPIRECLINSNWEDSQMAGIYVVRNHSNGNVTVGVYLVDLMCLGVKDTFFMFNVSESSFYDEIKRATREKEIVPVSYELVHNIVYTGLAFAEEYGFKPHKDFSTTTRYILEEDTDAIEEIEIVCGVDGKPAYMTGPNENSVRSSAIIAQLERAAGPGNYILLDVIDDLDDHEFHDDDDDDDDEYDDDEFDDDELTDATRSAMLATLNQLNQLSVDEKTRMLNNIDLDDEDFQGDKAFMLTLLTNSIMEDLTDRDKVQQYFDEFTQLFPMEVSEVPDPETLGLSATEQQLTQVMGERYNEALNQIADDPILGKQLVSQFAQESNRIPAAYYLELLLLRRKHPLKYKMKLAQYTRKFPDYPLFKLTETYNTVLKEEDIPSIPGYPFPKEFFFQERNHVHTTEFDLFLLIHTAIINLEGNIEKIRALYLFIEELETDTLKIKLAHTMCGMAQYHYIIEQYGDQS